MSAIDSLLNKSKQTFSGLVSNITSIPSKISSGVSSLETGFANTYGTPDVKKNIKDFVTGKRDLYSEVENLSKNNASKLSDKSLVPSGTLGPMAMVSPRGAANLGLGQVRTGAMALTGIRDFLVGASNAGEDITKGKFRNVAADYFKTLVGGLQIAGSAFRTTAFGQATTLGENTMFQTGKNIKENKPTQSVDFSGSASDTFLSDTLGIKKSHPYLSLVLDIGTNLLLGKGESYLSQSLQDGSFAKAVNDAANAPDAKAFKEEALSALNNEQGGVNFGADVGGSGDTGGAYIKDPTTGELVYNFKKAMQTDVPNYESMIAQEPNNPLNLEFKNNLEKDYLNSLQQNNPDLFNKVGGQAQLDALNNPQGTPPNSTNLGDVMKNESGVMTPGANVVNPLQNPMELGSGGVTPPVNGVDGAAPSTDPVQKIIDALGAAKPLEKKQAQIYSQARAAKVAGLVQAGQDVPGEAGYQAQLGVLKGELPKVSFESLRNQVSQNDIDGLFNKVEGSDLQPYDKITAKRGLAKLLGAEGGQLPTKSEIETLNTVFPPEFTQAIMDKRPIMQKLFEGGAEVLNVPRALMASFDMSAPLRQGAFLVGRPKQWAPAVGEMVKSFFSQDAYDNLLQDIKSRPTYPMMQENDLALTQTDSPILTGREESFMSNLAEKIPGVGIGVKASNRAYSGFLDKLRADTFDSLVEGAQKQGIDLQQNPKTAADIANFVNAATGRGDLGSLEKHAVLFNSVFFSPRLMASRLNLLNPIYYAKLDPFVRTEALKSLFTFAATGLAAISLAKLGGADVETDPRNANFAKIRVRGPQGKDTRYDVWGGFQQPVKLAAQLISGKLISSTTGKEYTLGQGYKPLTRLDIASRYFTQKEAPIVSFVTSLLQGKNSIGEDFNASKEVTSRLIPIVVQDLYNAYQTEGPTGILKTMPEFFGVGVQTYGPQTAAEKNAATAAAAKKKAEAAKVAGPKVVKPKASTAKIKKTKSKTI